MTPRWPLTSLLLRAHVWLYLRIIVSKSHGNTSLYMWKQWSILQNFNQDTTCILHTSLLKGWKYVDDLTLAENRSFPQPSGMQVVLDEFNEWTNNNKLSLTPSKCQALQICFKTNTPPHAELSIAEVPLGFVPEAMILKVWLQNDLQWDKNINEIAKKANQKLYILRLLKRFGFNDDELLSVYKCYVRPVVEYADVAWSSSITVAQRIILEHLQKRACRTILGQLYTTYADALETCGFESLADRREGHCHGSAEGFVNSERTNDLLPPTRLESHARNLLSGVASGWHGWTMSRGPRAKGPWKTERKGENEEKEKKMEWRGPRRVRCPRARTSSLRHWTYSNYSQLIAH